jgi:hypothetical protein
VLWDARWWLHAPSVSPKRHPTPPKRRFFTHLERRRDTVVTQRPGRPRRRYRYRRRYRPGRIRSSSVEANPILAPTSPVPLARASSATADATAPTTSRLKTEGMM